MDDLKEKIIKVIALGNAEMMEKLRYETWANKSLHELFDASFIEWYNSEEGIAIRAHIESKNK